MALLKGTKTAAISLACNSYSPPSWLGTIAHSHDSGSGGLLIVLVAYQGGSTINGVTYGGVSMTKQGTYTGSAQVSVDVYHLTTPTPGSQNIVVSSNSQITVGVLAQSFTGADPSVSNVQFSALANTPHSQTITISANSMILAWGQSIWSYDTAAAISIDGTGFGFNSCDIYGQVYTSQFCAHTRNANLTAGTKTVITDTQDNSWQTTNGRMEIKAAATPTTTRRIFVVG